MKKKIIDFIEKAKKLRVLVIGETIIDEFVEVIYQGQSMKSFCPVFRYTNSKKQIQKGGAGAIQRHLIDFVKSCDLITNTNNEIVKTRFIDKDGKKKHIELNKIESNLFGRVKANTKKYDVVIVADFGHGFCDNLDIEEKFHLMCQTNSNNFGFNRLSKWKKYHKKSVCLDLREASLQINEHLDQCRDDDAIDIYNYEINSDDLFITLGKKGSLYTNGNVIYRKSIFESSVVDTIGAGDTFFSFASLTSALGINDEDKLLIPSLAASLSTTWLCNEQSITKEKLINYANRYL